MSPFYQKRLDSQDKKEKRLKRVFHYGLLLCLTGIVVGFFLLAALAAWVSRDLPDPNILSTRSVPQSTKIYDRTGKILLYEIHGEEKRTLLPVEEIPDIVKQATIAIEDRRFYDHHGIYWRGLVRAAIMSLIKVQKVQGTSTLTQQLIKNAILNNERSLSRKFKEFILALQIERVYSKDQILQMYLNEIPYGSTLYGIESAAQAYFGKSAKNLTLDEAALLASIPQAPDYYSPYGTGSRGDNRNRLIGRQRYVLDQMAEQGFITKERTDAAKQIDVLKKIKPHTIGNIQAPHFVMYVKSLLSDKYGIKQVEQGGLNVITTLDTDFQKAAEEEVVTGVEQRGSKFGFTNAALVSLDPKNGQILAMVGSKDFFDADHDGQVNVTLRPRQPGSSFKPIVYAAGFIQGYMPETKLWDVETTFKTDIADYQPHNYDLKEHGPVTLRQALQGSLNIPAVKMLYLVGIGRVLDFAEALGYTTFSDRTRFGLSLVLGGGEVKPVEHAAAFGAFANDGILMPTSAILKVEDTKRTVLEEWKPSKGVRVMEPQIARLTSNILSDNDARAFIFGTRSALTLPNRPVAAKTGTTNNYHDAWTVGYTPSLVTTVWVGNNDNKEMKKGADGSYVAAPIWQAFMKRATRGTPIETFIEPELPSTDHPVLLGTAFEKKAKVDRISGKLATEFTPPDLVDERVFVEPHSILFYLDKDDPTGPVPTNPNTDPQFSNWESAVAKWVQQTGWNATNTTPLPTETDDIHLPNQQPKVTVLQPLDHSLVETRMISVQAVVDAPRPVVRLETFIDDKPMGIVSAAPWNFWITIPPDIQDGPHELLLVALDDAHNRGTATISFTLNAGLGSSTIPLFP